MNGSRWWERRSLALAALLGAGATTAGIALTATSGWLVVRASEQPAVLSLLTAVVAVRAFGIARPVLRYAERLRSHDASLRDLAERRAQAYARLVPLTPARLGRRRRADLLGGVVDDLTEVVEAQVRVTVPVAAAATAGVLTAVLTALLAPSVGPRGRRARPRHGASSASSPGVRSPPPRPTCWNARAELLASAQLVTGQPEQVRAAGRRSRGPRPAWTPRSAPSSGPPRRQSRGRAATAAAILVLVAATTVAAAVLARDLSVPIAVKGLLVLTPVAVVEAFQPLVEAVRASARARAASARLSRLLVQEPAVSDSPHARTRALSPHDDDRHTPRAHRRPGVVGRRRHRRRARSTSTWSPGPGCWSPARTAAGSRPCSPCSDGSSSCPAAGTPSTATDVRDLPVEEVRALVAVVDDEPHVFASTPAREPAARAAGRRQRVDGDAELVTALRRAGLGAMAGRRFRTGSTPVSAPADEGSPAASGPGSRSRGRCCRAVPSCCSTSRSPTSTTPRRADGARRRARWRARPVRGGRQPHAAERGVLRPRAGPQPGAGLAVRVQPVRRCRREPRRGRQQRPCRGRGAPARPCSARSSGPAPPGR